MEYLQIFHNCPHWLWTGSGRYPVKIWLTSPGFVQYFEDGAQWLLLMEEEERFLLSGDAVSADIDLLKKRHRRLYEGEYSGPLCFGSWANHAFASERLTAHLVKWDLFMAALRYEIRRRCPLYTAGLCGSRVLIRGGRTPS